MPTGYRWRRAAHLLSRGGIVACPTEAVYGLSCDPLNEAALLRLIELKQRDPLAGFIVIAASPAQIEPWLAPMEPAVHRRVTATWPGPSTWILPAAAELPDLLTGGRDTLAVRVTAHPRARMLCEAFDGPLVSTSANRTARRPARTALAVRRTFGTRIDAIVAGPTGGNTRPTVIRDGVTGAVLRG